jgi:hypothetical protein
MLAFLTPPGLMAPLPALVFFKGEHLQQLGPGTAPLTLNPSSFHSTAYLNMSRDIASIKTLLNQKEPQFAEAKVSSSRGAARAGGGAAAAGRRG